MLLDVGRDERAERGRAEPPRAHVVEGARDEPPAEPVPLETLVDLGMDQNDPPGTRAKHDQADERAAGPELVPGLGVVADECGLERHGVEEICIHTDMLTLYQAEWCPFSSSVRERLTELGLDFVARQVAPWPEQRGELLARTGTDQIPVLETEDGEHLEGTRAIFAYLERYEATPYASGHRQRYYEHRPAREADAPGIILERATPMSGARR
jgi:glutaredoxin